MVTSAIYSAVVCWEAALVAEIPAELEPSLKTGGHWRNLHQGQTNESAPSASGGFDVTAKNNDSVIVCSITNCLVCSITGNTTVRCGIHTFLTTSELSDSESIQITRRTMEEWLCNPTCNTWKKWATYWTDRCWTGTWRSTWILLSYLHLAVNWCRGNVSSLISLNNFCEHTILPVRSVSCLHMNLKPQMTRKLKRLNKKKKASRCLGQGRAKGGENERTPTEGSWWSDSSRTAVRDVWSEENDLV